MRESVLMTPKFPQVPFLCFRPLQQAKCDQVPSSAPQVLKTYFCEDVRYNTYSHVENLKHTMGFRRGALEAWQNVYEREGSFVEEYKPKGGESKREQKREMSLVQT